MQYNAQIGYIPFDKYHTRHKIHTGIQNRIRNTTHTTVGNTKQATGQSKLQRM